MKKMIRTITLLFAFGMTSFSHAQSYSVTVNPLNPEIWGYMGAVISINKNEPYYLITDKGRNIPISKGDTLYLTAYAMNVSPILDLSCQNLNITEDKNYILTFKLHQDWKIHCTLN